MLFLCVNRKSLSLYIDIVNLDFLYAGVNYEKQKG